MKLIAFETENGTTYINPDFIVCVQDLDPRTVATREKACRFIVAGQPPDMHLISRGTAAEMINKILRGMESMSVI